MKTVAIIFVISLGFSLAACVSPPQPPSSSLRFHYKTQDGQAVGLVRAFDDGRRTVLQFVTDPPPDLQIFDAARLALAYQRMGQYVVLSRLYNSVRVQTGGVSAVVTSATFSAPRAPMAPLSSRPNVVSVPQKSQKEMQPPKISAFQRVQRQVADLCSTLGGTDLQQLRAHEKVQMAQVQKMCAQRQVSLRAADLKKFD